MIQELTSYLDYSLFAELALAIFAAVFVAIVVRTLAIRTEDADQQARIVLDESMEKHSER